MKLPELEKPEKYVGLYIFDFGDHVGVGFTAGEVAELLESEKYRDGKVYRIPVNDDGTAGEAELFAELPVDSHMNGTTMDECGNLYAVASIGAIYRLSPDGEWEMAVDLRSEARGEMNLSSVNFGSGIGGWKRDALYVSPYDDEGFFEVVVGVRGKFEPHLSSVAMRK